MPIVSHVIPGERKASWTERVRLWFVHFTFPSVTWNLWARLLTLAAVYLLLLGGFVAFFLGGLEIAAGVYSFILGLLIFPFAWPIKRLKVILIVYQKYLIVGILHFCLAVFCFFSFTTATAGFVLVLSGLFYIIAHFTDEKSYSMSELKDGAYEKM